MEFITRYRRPVFTLAGVLFAVVFMTGSSFGQVKAGIRPGAMAGPAVIMNGRNIPKPEPIRCPNPVTLNLAAPAAAPGMNNPAPNHPFNYMFAWKMRNKCCQYLSASVTIKYIADQTGGWTSSTSGNDLISVAGMPSQHLYPQSAGAVAGHTYSMTIPLTAAALGSLTNTVKVSVEDDTQITSLTLHLTACCLTNGIST